MIDVFQIIVQPLHLLTLSILNFFRVQFVHQACPSWRPRMLELPSTPSNPTLWCEAWSFCRFFTPASFVGRLFNWFFISPPLYTHVQVNANTTDDSALCEWLGYAPETSSYSTSMQLYATVQLLLVCGALYPILVVVQSMLHTLWPSFARLSFNSQRYVVLNFGKAAILACQSFSAIWLSTVRDALLDTDSIRTLGQQKSLMFRVVQTMVFYVAIDFLALFMVPKLPSTSTRHHVFTVLLTLFIAPLDIFVFDTARMVLVYGTLSTVTYLVNAYLGVFKVYNDLHDQVMLNKRRLRFLAAFTLLVYAVECAFNWFIQAQWFATNYLGNIVSACFNGSRIDLSTTIATIYFIIMVSVFVRDDLILAKAVWRTASGGNKSKAGDNAKALLSVIEDVVAINNSATVPTTAVTTVTSDSSST